MKVKRENSSGYTLIELLIAVAVVGIIASTVSFSVFDLVVEKRSEHDVLGFWSELSALRARALKDNVGYQVVLDVANNNYEIQRMDATGNVVVDVPGLRSHITNLVFGRPKLSNGNNAPDIDLKSGLAAGDVDGERFDGVWAADGAITFTSDEMGSISSGVLYVKNKSVPEVGYAIVKYPNLHTIKLLKWSRTQWYEM